MHTWCGGVGVLCHGNRELLGWKILSAGQFSSGLEVVGTSGFEM